MERNCRLCAGSGWIDEITADRLGIHLPHGRTEICPQCTGSGDGFDRPAPAWLFLAVGVTFLVGLGLMVLAIRFGLHQLQAMQ